MAQRMQTFFRNLIIVTMVVTIQACAANKADAEPSTINLSQADTYYEPLVRHLVHVENEDLTVGIQDILSGALEFSPIKTPHADFGVGPSRHWLWSRVHNGTASGGIWRIDIRRQFLQELTVYAVHDDRQVEVLIKHSDENVFSDRIINSRFLQANIEIERDEAVDIYIAYRSSATTFLPPAIGTIDGVAGSQLQEIAIDAIFNGGLVAMFVLTLLFMPIVGWKLSVSFCAYIAAGALFVHQADGYTYRYLWPNSPQFNDAANLSFMLLMPVFSLSFARFLFRTPKMYPVWDKVLLGYVVIAAMLAVLTLAYIHIPLLMTLAYSFVPVGALIQLLTGLSMFYRQIVGATPYFIGAVGVAISFGYALIAHLQPGYWSLDRTLDVGHASILLECFAFASAIVLRMVALRTERDVALKKELVEARNRLKAERDLRKAQADFAHANKLSEERLNQLTNVSHDLQAPLKTLRRVVGQIGHGSETATGRMHAALDYLEDLARLEMTKGIRNIRGEKKETLESFPVGVVLNNITELFAERATAEDIVFRQRVRDVMIVTEPVVLMRVVSNLVGNAIEHAQSTKIVMASRMRSGKVIIQVWDNGVGINAENRTLIFKHGRKGAESSGSGFGLSIVAEECAAAGIAFDVCSKEGRGTCITLTIPVA